MIPLAASRSVLKQHAERLAGVGPAGQRLRDQQLSALRAPLSGSCAALQDQSRGSYATLGTRIEQLLRLAEEQASAIVDTARAEAAEITSPASKQPCPRCGQG